MLVPFVVACLTLHSLCLPQDAGSGPFVVDRERGFSFRFPSPDWKVLNREESGGAYTLMAQNPVQGGLFVVVVARAGTESAPESIAASRAALHARSLGDQVKNQEITPIEHAGAKGERLVLEHGDPAFLLIEHLFLRDGKLFIVQGRHKKDDARAKADVASLFESFGWDLPPEGTYPEVEAAATQVVPPALIPIPEPPVLKIERATEGRIILVRSTGNFEQDARLFALSLPLARAGEAPVCLLVGETLTCSQVDLLNRLPVREIVAVGDPPQAIASFVTRRVATPAELATRSREAVVASSALGDILEAAPLAFRQRVPLLVAGDDLAQELERLGVEKVSVVAARGEVTLPEVIDDEDMSDPEVRWEDATSGSRESDAYLALANIGTARREPSGAVLGATLLAARHSGMLLVLDEEVRFEYATLEMSDTVPQGVASQGRVALGRFNLPEGALDVALPTLGPLVGLAPIDKFGDLILDLDRDGTFDPQRETVEPGAVREVGGTAYSFSLRAIGAVGTTKFMDALQTNRAVAITPPAERITEQLFATLEGLPLPRYLLIAGDHREIPFDYVKDPVYAESTMHEQELCSDNLYADPDSNGYLDIAMGRFVSTGPAEATSLASRMAAYDRLAGEWRGNTVLVYPCWAEDEMKLGMPIVFAAFEALMRGLDLDLRTVGFTNRLHLRDHGDLPAVYPHLTDNALIVFAHHAGPTTWLFRMQGQSPNDLQMLLPARSEAARKLGPGSGVVPPLRGAPIVVSGGCDSAGLDYEVSAAESIVHSFFEQGAVAYVGNTRAGFPDAEEHLMRLMLQRALGLGVPSPSPCGLGEAFRNGKNYFDYLIRKRGPFTSTPPFQHYDVAMRREWCSLVYYGDPALKMRLPREPVSRGVTIEVRAENDPTEIEVRVTREAAIEHGPIQIMEQVGLGPVREITNVSAPGLVYGSVPWGTYPESARPGRVLPGVFLDLPLGAVDPATLALVEGPSWALGPHDVVEDARGERRMRLAVDLIRYAMAAPEQAEVADRVVVKISRGP
ncbi:MAG: C25 family cysteine peptidase [Planctomycetota bacterium]